MPDSPPDLFISYSSKDRPWANRLFDDLRARFPTMFPDTMNNIAWDRNPASLPPGTDWRKWITSHAKNATHFAVLWSQAAKESDEVAPEIEAFRQNVDEYPTTRNGTKRGIFYIPLEGDYGALKPVQGFPDLRPAYAPAAHDRGISNLEQAPHCDEWRRMVGIIGRTMLNAEATQPITLALMVMSTEDLKYLDWVLDDVKLGRPTLREYLEAIGLTLEDAKSRYGATVYDWRPFGTSKSIIDVMEDAREIAHRNLPKEHWFHWEPTDFLDAARTVDPGALPKVVDNLTKGLSVLVTDPISLFNLAITSIFNKLGEYAKKPASVILSISPNEFSGAERFYGSLFRNGVPLLESHFRPQIPFTESFARCGINVQHAMDIERLIRGGLGYHALERMKAASKAFTSGV